MSETTSPDFDFRHHLRDTLLLLGAGPLIAELMVKSQDGNITAEDVKMLQNYNLDLIDRTKHRLASLNKMRVRVKPPEESGSDNEGY